MRLVAARPGLEPVAARGELAGAQRDQRRRVGVAIRQAGHGVDQVPVALVGHERAQGSDQAHLGLDAQAPAQGRRPLGIDGEALGVDPDELTGTPVLTSYDDGEMDFADLLESVDGVPGIARIRFTTSHPLEFNQNLIDCYASVLELVSHLHLPVQSGSDRILMQMKRGHTALEYKHKIRQLQQIRPGISISSDFIIGFPGETEEDFRATMKLIEDIGFDTSFSFIYSARPGTPAAALDDPTPREIKQRRLRLLKLEESRAETAGTASSASARRVPGPSTRSARST